MGLNEHGIGLVENGLASDSDGKYAYEKPFHVRCREVLDADRFDQALLPILGQRRVASANFVVGHADGEIIDLESSPDRVTALHPRDGLVTHSNHFIDPRHGVSQMERIGPSTLFRAARLERLLRQDLGRLEAKHFRAAFADHFSHPTALCRHPDERQPAAKRTMTCASVLLDLRRRVMHVANGPPCEHDYVEFALDRPLAAVA
jgi:isopenicillin-N N-acyltransferase-like protein